MKSKKGFIQIFSIVSAVIFVLLCAVVVKNILSERNKGVKVLRLSEVHADDYPTSLADLEFARLVNEKTNGRIKVEIYTNGRLYNDEVEALDALRSGAIDFARISSAPVGYIVPKINLIQLPFLYKNREHFLKTITGSVGEFIINSIEIEDVGLVGLCFYDAGVRSFYSKNEIRTADDLIGKKIRIQTTPIMATMCELLGATGIIGIPPTEVYNKILNGIVDGAENNIPTYENMGDYLAAPYYIKTEHVRIPDILLASSRTFDELSLSDVEIIRECAKMTQLFQIGKWEKKEIESENIVKNTSKIVELSDEELETFRKKVKPIYEQYESEYGRVIKLIKDIN